MLRILVVLTALLVLASVVPNVWDRFVASREADYRTRCDKAHAEYQAATASPQSVSAGRLATMKATIETCVDKLPGRYPL